MGNLKYHTKIIHLGLGKKIKFKCNHSKCDIKFKTYRQKNLHHDKTEVECKNENQAIINLLQITHKLFISITAKININNNLNTINDLNLEYNKVSQVFLDTGRENFNSMMN